MRSSELLIVACNRIEGEYFSTDSGKPNRQGCQNGLKVRHMVFLRACLLFRTTSIKVQEPGKKKSRYWLLEHTIRMTDEFQLKEGMFLVVPCKTTDPRVLRLKKLVKGYEMGCYEPKPLRQFEQETKHKTLGPNLKQQKTAESDNGVELATKIAASCSKPFEQPIAVKQKLVSGNLILEQDQRRKTSSVSRPSEVIKEETMNSSDNTKDRNNEKQPPSNTYSLNAPARSEKVSSKMSSNSLKHSQRGSSLVSLNPLRHPSSNASTVSRKTTIYLPSVPPQVTRVPFAQRLTERPASRNHKNHPPPDSLVRRMATPPSATPVVNGNLSANRHLGTSSNSQTHSTRFCAAASLVDRKTVLKPSVTLSIPEKCSIPKQAGTVPVKHSNTVNLLTSTSSVSRMPSNHPPSVKSSVNGNLPGHRLRGNSSIRDPPKNRPSNASPVIRRPR